MRILQINSVCGTGSTGRIAASIGQMLEAQGHESFIAYGRGVARNCNNAMKIGTRLDNYVHAVMTRLFDAHCYGSRRPTQVLVSEIMRIDPDVVHLHNIHGYYLNMEVLFDYLAEANKPVVWTLHDCWAFTGHCAYFDYVRCDRWKRGCYECPQSREYPSSVFADNSRRNFSDKKMLFTQLQTMMLVTPSRWLSRLVEQSFLGKYPIKVINNGVDLDTFRPRESPFRRRLHLEDKFIVLGVANTWDRRKGLRYLLELPARLPERVVVVVVGLSQSQMRKLPPGIIGIARTSSVEELADIYSAADVFVNPTLEDNFPTTNLEALACGTPVITFDAGGSSESISADCGLVVERGNMDALVVAVKGIMGRPKRAYQDSAVRRAKLYYNERDRFQEYITLYASLIRETKTDYGTTSSVCG